MKKIVLLCLFIISCSSKSYVKKSYQIIYPNQITITELVYIIKTLDPSKLLIVDLRSSQKYENDHILGALSIPYHNIQDLGDIPDIKSKRIIFYDTRGVSFSKIKKELKKLNITQFSLLQQGFNN